MGVDFKEIRLNKCCFLIMGMVILFAQTNCFALNFNKDSLLFAGYHNPDMAKRVDALLLISDHYNSFFQDSAIKYTQEAYDLADKNNLVRGEAHALYAYSAIYINSKHLAKARDFIYQGIKFSEKQNYVDGKIEGYMHFSYYYEMLGKTDSMMYYSLNALELTKQTSNVEIKAGVAHDIGNLYSYEGNYDKALFYCNQSLDAWNKIGHKNIAGILSDIGNIYYNKKDLNNALACYKKAYENAKENNDALAYGYSLNNIGLVYFELDSIGLAIDYYKSSIKYYTFDLNKQGIANAELNLANAYLKQGKYDIAFNHARVSLELAGDQNYKKGILGAYTLMALAEGKMKHFENAWKYQTQASYYQDTLNKLALNKKIADFESKFEIEKTDNENKLLKASQLEQLSELKRENQLTILIGVIMILCLVIAVLAGNISRKRKHELMLLAKLNQEILDQKQKLEDTNEVKIQLFSIVSHDFKGPLASLHLFLELLESGDLDDGEIKQLAHELKDRMNITFTFIDNLLGWAQSQLKGYQPNPININLHDIVEDSFNLYKKQADTKLISLFNNIPQNEEIVTDNNMLKLVLRNLVSNALKYTDADGKIELNCSKTADNMIVSVKDTGVGMTKEMQERLFTNQRINTIGTANEPGTGLGLMLCKEFIEKNGGSIRVESEPGKGSTFSFTIPLGQVILAS